MTFLFLRRSLTSTSAALSLRASVAIGARAERVPSLQHFGSVRYASTSTSDVPTSVGQAQSPATTTVLSPSASSSSSSTTAVAVRDEIHRALISPTPVGHLFRTLSPNAKSHFVNEKISLEQFLLRHPTHFAVFQEPGERYIMASRVAHVPQHALRGSEATADQLFGQRQGSPVNQAVLTILKYVPNEWAAFVDLGIPEGIRVNVMNRKAKAYFERHPQYFEVQAQGLNQHTFFVRRALSLQQQVASNSNNNSPPPQ